MSAPPPPVPPRPYFDSAPTIAFDPYRDAESAPHYADPLVAPRPHRVDPQIGANMARDLDNTLASANSNNYAYGQQQPGFIAPSANVNNNNNYPPPPGAQWNPWAPPGSAPTPVPGLGVNAGAFGGRTPSPMPIPMRLPSPPRDGSLTVPLPSLPALTAALPAVTGPAHDPALQLAWARDVLFLVDRTPELASGPLAQAAVPLVLGLCGGTPPPAEALYLRATFASAAAPPAFAPLVPRNPRAAFRDFETAARAGWGEAWYRLARDYEAFSDFPHALDCLARGAKAGDPASLHRLGTAHLLGQLGLGVGVEAGLGYLSKAAMRASLQCPAPAYVFALILLGEFTTGEGRPVGVPGGMVQGYLPPGQTPPTYARALLERAAALHFAPAQYKLGHAFEFAVPVGAFPFDPLLSVQWYSLASQAGEAEADMALSK
ncbi:hypothetical protein B0H11DRAFT_2212154, partial [Mycena galericulata]